MLCWIPDQVRNDEWRKVILNLPEDLTKEKRMLKWIQHNDKQQKTKSAKNDEVIPASRRQGYGVIIRDPV